MRRAAYTISEGKGAPWYGIGPDLARIKHAIARDEAAVQSVSTVTTEVCGLHDDALSVPRVFGSDGVTAEVLPDLAPEETEALAKSAWLLKTPSEQISL